MVKFFFFMRTMHQKNIKNVTSVEESVGRSCFCGGGETKRLFELYLSYYVSINLFNHLDKLVDFFITLIL